MKQALAVAAAFGIAAPALAGNLDPAPVEPVIVAPAPVVPVGTDWSGGYVGGQVGYGFGDFSTNVDDFDSDGILGGLHAGYNWDLGDWVLGAEVQYDWSDLSLTTDTGSGTFDEIGRLKLRAGRDLGQTLVYGSAGLAYANFDDDGAFNFSFDDPGYVVGVGVDRQIGQNWVAGLEYQYHMFNDFGADGNDVDLQTIHARASYRF